MSLIRDTSLLSETCLVYEAYHRGGQNVLYILHTSTAGFIQAVLVLAVPSQYENARQSSGKFSLAVQLLPNSDYQVKYEVDQQVFPVQTEFSNNHIQAHPFHYMHSSGPDELPPEVQTKKEGLSDEELKKLGIAN